jgi:hypothetical protein
MSKMDPTRQCPVRALAGVLAVLMTTVCFPPSEGAEPVDDGEPGPGPSADAVSFRQDVHPLLQSACSDCHSDQGEAGTTLLVFTAAAADDHGAVAELVNIQSPEQSYLLTKATNTQIHMGGVTLDPASASYDTVVGWIREGAEDN